jgi:hypothetical protein
LDFVELSIGTTKNVRVNAWMAIGDFRSLRNKVFIKVLHVRGYVKYEIMIYVSDLRLHSCATFLE